MFQVSLSMLTDDASDFVLLVEGYYKISVDKDKTLLKSLEEARHNSAINNNRDAEGKAYYYT